MRISLFAALLATAIVASAFQPPKAARPKMWDSGWAPLFNGTDLTGWVPVGHEKWEVEDGAIHGQGVSKEYGYLRTDKKYVDFHLSLRFKCENVGNSGVF